MKNNFKKTNGFTLIETIVVIGILLIVAVISANFINTLYKFQKGDFARLVNIERARGVMETMVYEIRKINQAETGAYPIESAGPQSFVFYSDIDEDSLTEKTRYFLSGSTLKKGVIEPAGNPFSYPAGNEIITDVSQEIVNNARPIFYYYDRDYTGSEAYLADPVSNAAVRLVRVLIFVDNNPNTQPIEIELDSKVQIRNLKDNL